MPQTIGRFQIRQLLGSGAQSAVYLAHDPQLERDVALKLLRLQPGASAPAFIHEARAVSRLKHEGIVPIFEAGEHEGRPYLVFEYVEGRTLARRLRDEGAMPPAQACTLMVSICEALEHAHHAGVIHRDLKPSNILLTREGRPRLTDFGIAVRLATPAGAEEALLGTPAYMAPEYIREKAVGPQNDVFALGLILFEMLFGRRAIQAENSFQAMHQIANEPLVFPREAPGKIDAALHDIVAKATARDPVLRYRSAAELQQALEQYLAPAAAAEAPTGQGTLDFLLRRMRHKSDFPAMSGAISAINRLALSDRSDVNALAAAILKDFALTNKILRLANSAYYPQFGGTKVSTVSRAIVVLGFDAVRNIAISLMLFEHLRDKKHAELLKEEFLRANFAGILGRELAPAVLTQGTEEAFICALFHNLGRLLTHYYFPEEAEAIGRLIAHESCEEAAAAARVLGLTYADLGIGIARSWGFPETIVHSLRPLPAGKATRPTTDEERLRVLAEFSASVGAAIERSAPGEREAALKRLTMRFGGAIDVSAEELAARVDASAQGLVELARVLGLDLSHTPLGQKLAQVAKAAPPPAAAPADAAAPASASATPEPTAAAHAEPDGATVLTAGIQDISQALVEDFQLGDLLRIVLETIFRAIPVQRVLLCMRDGRHNVMSARFGLGAGVDELTRQLRFELGGTDFFNRILARDVDVLITDAADAKVARHLPEWYRRHFSARSFLVLPLRVGNAPVAMIYADNEAPGSVVVSQKELSLLRTLRNQAVLAIRQSK